MNENDDKQTNGVNERAGATCQQSLSNDSVENQANHGRQPTTSTSTVRRRRYIREDNRVFLECCYRSRPNIIRYPQRMIDIWKEKDRFDINERRMADQVRTIKKSNGLRQKKWKRSGKTQKSER